jgi:hypothetical protein
MKFIKQTKFWQLPLSLKLVVTWFFIVAVNNFWRFVYLLIARYSLDLVPLILGIVEWGLAIGIINKSNEARSWTAFFVFLGTLFSLFLLAIALYKDPRSVEGFNMNYDRFTRTQMIGFFVAYFILNVGILFALLRPKTRAFFSSENSQQESA